MKPEEIEKNSFDIIDSEAGPHGFTELQWSIVRRMIHTSADFEYMKSVRIHPEAIEAGIKAIRNGKTIFTDTQMARIGMRQSTLSKYGTKVKCLITDPTVVKIAADRGMTRARAAVDAAAQELEGGIYVVGNAPTALLRLLELAADGKVKPAMVIGLPVGFVNAAESKDALIQTDIPHISNVGRKGGSNVAASVVNALTIIAESTPRA